MTINLKDTFNNVVTMYDAARPTYPIELLNDVKEFAEKTLFNDGLEIGAGTGQATDLFINSIKTLDIVEVGDKQIELEQRYLNYWIALEFIFSTSSFGIVGASEYI